jgi:predicted N-acetyltransferase YhbS
MISALRPSELIYHMLELFERAEVGAYLNIYFMAGLWVHPEHRRRGLGTRMVKEGLELVWTNMDLQNH